MGRHQPILRSLLHGGRKKLSETQRGRWDVGMITRTLTAVLTLVLLAGCNSGGSSSPTPGVATAWQRFRGDSANSGRGLGPAAVTRAEVTRIAIDETAPLSPITSSPAIGSDGTVYIGSEGGTLKALTPDGELRWSARSCGACPAAAQALGKLQSSPATYSFNNHTWLFVGSGSGRVYIFEESGGSTSCTGCFDPRTSDPDISHVDIASSPLFVTHSQTANVTAIIVGASIERFSAAGVFGKVYAIAADATLLWDYPRGTGWPAGFTASPALGGGRSVVISSDEGTVHAIGQNGTPLWTSTIGLFRDSGTLFAQSPIVAAGLVFVNTVDGQLAALTQDGRTRLWQRSLSGTRFTSSMALAFQPPLTATPTPEPPQTPTPTSTALNGERTATPTPIPGEEATNTPTPSATISPTPFSLVSTLFAVSEQGELLIIDSRSGALIESSELQESIDGTVVSSGAYSSDGHLVFGSTNGTVYALNGTTGLSAWPPISLSPGYAIRSSPSIALDGTIWVGSDDGYLYRIGVEP